MGARIADPEELDALLAIRREVFVEGQGVPAELEVDGLDPACAHFAATTPDGALAGTARLRITADGVAKAERVAVLASARGLGLGRALMDALEAEARRRGHREVVLYAQVPVVGFYERLGYRGVGDVFVEAGIDHLEMRKPLG